MDFLRNIESKKYKLLVILFIIKLYARKYINILENDMQKQPLMGLNLCATCRYNIINTSIQLCQPFDPFR